MALENEVQCDTIPELNELWPTGTDAYSQGDNHIRLIKKVLKTTFPNLTGPVTLTPDQINRGSVPIGSVTVFWQAAAPTGWIRSLNVSATYGIRIIPTAATTGGGGGGTDDPILNNKVSTHYHTVNATSSNQGEHQHSVQGATGGQDALHTHAVRGTTGSTGHQHYINLPTSQISEVYNNGNIPSGGAGGNAALGTGQYHQHQVTGFTDNTDHTHTINVQSDAEVAGHHHQVDLQTPITGWHTHTISTSTSINPSAANWIPRYMDVIMCERTG